MLRSFVLVAALALASAAQAQEAAPETGAQSGPVSAPDTTPRDEFRQTAIPDTVDARFVCYQSGVEILAVNAVSSFAPARVQEVMTFSLRTRRGETHLIYLGPGTACRLVVTDR